MKIFADENMPLVEELFAGRGEIIRGAGRHLTVRQLADVDVLLVRSVTKANAELLEGTTVKFVGSATAGIDHVDQEYLQRAGIEFAYAPGCNANSVAEYVVAALLSLAVRDRFELAGKSIGIVGHGQVGSRVAAKCRALGMETLVNDPPLTEQGVELDCVELNDLLGVDILTLHVPLTFDGKYVTANLIDADWLSRIGRPGMMIINTCRGGVLDETALWQGRASGLIGQVVLDVYQGEKSPQRVSGEALAQADIATPHIAGYSYDGKALGTVMLYEALAKRYGWPLETNATASLKTEPRDIRGPARGSGLVEKLHQALRQAYDIQQDHQKLHRATGYQGPRRGVYFDSLRRDYAVRREFTNYQATAESGYSAKILGVLKELGFSY